MNDRTIERMLDKKYWEIIESKDIPSSLIDSEKKISLAGKTKFEKNLIRLAEKAIGKSYYIKTTFTSIVTEVGKTRVEKGRVAHVGLITEISDKVFLGITVDAYGIIIYISPFQFYLYFGEEYNWRKKEEK